MKMNRFLMTLATAGIATAMIGCGSDDDDEVTISGTAAKGILKNAIVNIFPIADGVVSTTSLGSATSQTDGTYTLTVDEFTQPFIVRITADTSTQMTCDLAAGCGDGVPFGSDYSLGSSFELDAVSAAPSESTTVNVTALTDIAAATTVSQLSSIGTSSVAEAIATANNSIAERFGLPTTTSLTQIPVVDVTSPTALAAANDDTAVTLNLLNAAIVQAVRSDNTSVSIEDAVTTFSNQFVANGGMADRETSATSTVTLSEVLAQTSAIITQVQTVVAAATDVNVNLDAVNVAINAQTSAAANGSTTPTGVPNLSAPTGATGGSN